MNSSTAMAVASPILNSVNMSCTMSVPMTCTCVVGVWLVRSQMVSKAFIPPMTMNTMEMDSTSQMSGRVMVQNCRHDEAPSMSAAS